MVFAKVKKPTDLEVILLGGSLGAGKTTLTKNLIENGSFNPQSDGIVVMDAAGNIDYQRISSLAQQRGIAVENATSACTVCDGPNAAFGKIEELQKKGINRILIEQSGQMPLPTMIGALGSKGIFLPKSMYLLDPKNFRLVGAADELPFAHLVGITKRDAESKELKLIRKYGGEDLPVYRVPENTELTLDEMLKLMRVDNNTSRDESLSISSGLGLAQQIVSGNTPSKPLIYGLHNTVHKHSSNPDEVNEFHNTIQNPYHTRRDLKRRITQIAQEYDRVKGRIALDSNRILEFDGVGGDVSFRVIEDPNLGNGTILVANQDGKFFSKEKLEDRLSFLVDKPENPPVMRIYSPREDVIEYVEQSISSNDFDSAFGAIDQAKYERRETLREELTQKYVPQIIEGMWEFVNNDSSRLDDSQKTLKLIPLLYGIETHQPNSPLYTPARDKFMQLYNSVNRDELAKLTDEETIEFGDSMFSRYLNEQRQPQNVNEGMR